MKWILLIALVCATVSAASTAGACGDEKLPNNFPNNAMEQAVEVLSHLPSGKVLLSQAKKFWNLHEDQELLKVLKPSSVSRTDAVLTRKFNSENGSEVREREVVVYIRNHQRLRDIVLDLSHELIHATSRPIWDPYDPKLTAGKYVWAAIEGQGGEVDAVMSECRIERELEKYFGVGGDRCHVYQSLKSKRLRERVTRDFYRVGSWREEVRAKLGSESVLFPLLTADSPKLYSSTGHAPYPVALYREFEVITQIACENSSKRVSSRSPASFHGEIADFLQSRCKSFH